MILDIAHLNQELEILENLEGMIFAYEEIAALRMQKIRKKVLSHREYLTDLNRVFQQVRISYSKGAKKRDPFFGERNGKTVRVLISANTGLYGEIVKKTFVLFLDDVKKEGGEVIILGRVGRDFFSQAEKSLKFSFFDFPDQGVDFRMIKEITDSLFSYQKVIIYHGLYKTVLTQEATATNIRGEELLPKEENILKKRLIFEPSLEEVLVFFETQIFTSLLIQTVQESLLAKFSSRMVTLDRAVDNIKDNLGSVLFLANREKHRSLNRKQLNSLQGVFWAKSTYERN